MACTPALSRRPGFPCGLPRTGRACTVQTCSPRLRRTYSLAEQPSTPRRGHQNESSPQKELSPQPAAAAAAAAPQGSTGSTAKLVASVGVVGGLVLLAGGSYLLKDHIAAFLDFFIQLVEEWGPLGYLAYIVVYATLEVLAVPAIPLTVTAGAIFDSLPQAVAVVSIAATTACTISFLIARYLARDRVLQYAANHPKFAAIDKAIGQDGFRVVVLLRLSPLLPLAASNYLYGLTSVDLRSYVLGSWLGMLPGTAAYVAAGTYSKQLLQGGGGVEGLDWWQAALALGISAVAAAYIGRLASNALAGMDSAGEGEGKGEGGEGQQ